MNAVLLIHKANFAIRFPFFFFVYLTFLKFQDSAFISFLLHSVLTSGRIVWGGWGFGNADCKQGDQMS